MPTVATGFQMEALDWIILLHTDLLGVDGSSVSGISALFSLARQTSDNVTFPLEIARGVHCW